MKILFLGGTGLISSACTALARERGHAVTLLNRGQRTVVPPPTGVEILHADLRDRAAVESVLQGRTFDAVVNWIAFTPEQVEQDLAVFTGRCAQYVFISSASAYQKPPDHYVITEETKLENVHWEYSRNKIACEQRLMRAWHEAKVPVTIVRPSLTYSEVQIPLAMSCWHAPYTLIRRVREGRPLIVPGDGTSLWVITHNTDFAKGLVGLLGHPQAAGEAFHITTDEVHTWNQFYELFAEAAGAKLNPVHIASDFLIRLNPDLEGTLIGDKSISTVFDNSKLKRYVPDFKATMTFREGIRRTVQWFDTDPSRQTVDPKADSWWDRAIAAAEAGIAAFGRPA